MLKIGYLKVSFDPEMDSDCSLVDVFLGGRSMSLDHKGVLYMEKLSKWLMTKRNYTLVKSLARFGPGCPCLTTLIFGYLLRQLYINIFAFYCAKGNYWGV